MASHQEQIYRGELQGGSLRLILKYRMYCIHLCDPTLTNVEVTGIKLLVWESTSSACHSPVGTCINAYINYLSQRTDQYSRQTGNSYNIG